MSNYIDGFVLPIPTVHLDQYKAVATKIANIWKEHGALGYFEYSGDDMHLEGTKSFPEALIATENETIIFGWVVFESREARDLANKLVANDSRMEGLVAPLINSENIIFDASRMVFGGFKSMINHSD